MTRTKMPTHRPCETRKLKYGGLTIYLRTGFRPDGTPGEVFIDTCKDGAAMRVLCNALAKMISIGLQHGAPFRTVCKALHGVKTEPGPVSGSDNVEHADSIVDLIARQLWIDHGDGSELPKHESL